MKDLFLTPRGDLSIENIIESRQRLEINFITSKSNALNLNFFIEDTFTIKPPKNSLSINFQTNVFEEDKEFRVITGNSVMEQAIKIRLLSSLGSIQGNLDIGSKIETIKHAFIDNDSTKIQLEKLIKQAISDIISNPIIKIETPSTKYLDYSTSLKVSIVDNNKKYSIQL